MTSLAGLLASVLATLGTLVALAPGAVAQVVPISRGTFNVFDTPDCVGTGTSPKVTVPFSIGGRNTTTVRGRPRPRPQRRHRVLRWSVVDNGATENPMGDRPGPARAAPTDRQFPTASARARRRGALGIGVVIVMTARKAPQDAG
jgi:hypothetical protein